MKNIIIVKKLLTSSLQFLVSQKMNQEKYSPPPVLLSFANAALDASLQVHTVETFQQVAILLRPPLLELLVVQKPYRKVAVKMALISDFLSK